MLLGRVVTQHQATVVSLALVAVLFSACSTSHVATPLTGSLPGVRGASPDNQARLQALLTARTHRESGSDYVVAPGDLLAVTIYNFRPEGGNFESEVRVDDQGYISVPIIAPIRVTGLSVAQVRAAVVDALRHAQVLNQPLVSVFLKDYQGQQVVVLGAVSKPGMYHLSRGEQSLVDVVSLAGGLTQTSGNYLLFRPAPTSPHQAGADSVLQQYALKSVSATARERDDEMVVINIEDLESRDGGTNPALLALTMRGGDLVIVPDAGQAFIDGEVAKPGPYPLTHGMTLTQLVTSAGGLTYPADGERIQLIRGAATSANAQWEVDIGRIQHQEQEDVLLERNDHIIVPAQTGRKIAYGFYQVLNNVVRFTVGGAATFF